MRNTLRSLRDLAQAFGEYLATDHGAAVLLGGGFILALIL